MSTIPHRRRTTRRSLRTTERSVSTTSLRPRSEARRRGELSLAVDERRAGERRGDDAAVGGEGAFALADRLRREAAGELRFLERVQRFPVGGDDALDEVGGFAVQRRHV